MNDTVDVFDFRESRLDSLNVSRESSLGDLSGVRLLASYGLSDSLLLSSQYAFRELNVSLYDYEIDTFELSLNKKLSLDKGFYTFIAGGIRYDIAGDYRTSDIDEIDQLVGRVDSDLSVSSSPSRVNLTDGEVTISSPIVNPDGSLKDPLTVELHGNYDFTLFARSGIGKTLGRAVLVLFFELGHSEVRGSLSHNFDLYGVDDSVVRLTEFDPDFDRNENFIKLGFDSQVSLTDSAYANVVYFYHMMDRDSDLDYIDYNHVVQADLVYRFNDFWAINLGAEYYYRQFNGVIPLLYNQYTETTFDHDYGVVHCGLTLTF